MVTNGNDLPDSTWIPFLINLRTAQYVVFDCGFTSKSKLYITPRYILLVSSQPMPLAVRIYSIASLERLWRPLSEFTLENATSELMIAPTTIPITGDVGPRDNDDHSLSQVEVFLTESILRRNTYLLRVFDTVISPGVPGSVTIASIHRLNLTERGT
ncbi:hypothetical protein C8R45DRAFT_433291 [Mycena sanguinolenta]|nr:hypothetical protein C8R45DRAFT_433291 [Mycena sanguinolenta]